MCFEDWYTNVGYRQAEELEEWLNNKPDFLHLHDVNVYDIEEFVDTIIEQNYKLAVSEYEDYQYHEWKDSRVNLGDIIAAD